MLVRHLASICGQLWAIHRFSLSWTGCQLTSGIHQAKDRHPLHMPTPRGWPVWTTHHNSLRTTNQQHNMRTQPSVLQPLNRSGFLCLACGVAVFAQSRPRLRLTVKSRLGSRASLLCSVLFCVNSITDHCLLCGRVPPSSMHYANLV